MVSVHRYLTEHQKLHRQLNSRRCPETIDSDYDVFWAKYRDLRTASEEALAWRPGLAVSFHDAFVRNLTERRGARTYRTHFQIDAFVYEGQQEVGKLPVFFNLTLHTALREIHNKEVYALIVDPQRQELGVAYHVPWRRMRLVVAPYAHFTHRFGELALYADRPNPKDAS